MARRSKRLRIGVGCLLLGLMLGTAADASAQQTRSISISDGEVYIDGRRLSEHEIPRELDARDLQLQYTFSGEGNPVVRIGNNFFILENDRLRIADDAEKASSFFDYEPGIGSPKVRVEFRTDEPGDISRFAAPHSSVLQRKARELHDQAVRLEQLQSDIRIQNGSPDLRAIQEAARQVRVHAGEAARMAAAMPHMQVQNYLEDIQQRNRSLFDRLVVEREMERETLHLAGEIRSMSEGIERTTRTEELRAKLDDIFELKQQNRRQEVLQLEERLEDLQRKLQQREQLREEIVERRLHRLLGLDGEGDW